MQRKALVLHANILIRAGLAERVRRIVEVHADSISFFLPEAAYAESEEHLAALVVKRGGEPSTALIALNATAALATMVGDELEQHCEMRPAVEMSYQYTRDGRNGQGRWFQDHQSTVASAGKLANGQLSDSCSGMRCEA